MQLKKYMPCDTNRCIPPAGGKKKCEFYKDGLCMSELVPAILISIKPEWCLKILTGEKTIEVRKKLPWLSYPFTCFIYCTKDKTKKLWLGKDGPYIDKKSHSDADICLNGQIIGEFTCNKVLQWNCIQKSSDVSSLNLYNISQKVLQKTMLTPGQLSEYGAGKQLYGFVISDMNLYDAPVSITELNIKTPPQSWRYV